MKIGIIVAMSKELALLLHNIEDESRVTVNNRNFYIGRIGRHEVVLAQCGIGKVNAAVGTLTLIENFHPSLIINTGVAGGTGMGARVMDVVVATAVAYHDVWCGPDTEWGQAADCPRLACTRRPWPSTWNRLLWRRCAISRTCPVWCCALSATPPEQPTTTWRSISTSGTPHRRAPSTP